jgi:hypothetical protein
MEVVMVTVTEDVKRTTSNVKIGCWARPYKTNKSNSFSLTGGIEGNM